MNIGDISQGGLKSSEHLKNHQIEKATPVNPRISDRAASGSSEQPPKDTVSISEAGRLAMEEDRLRKTDLDTARTALNNLPDLSAERRAELMERLNNQYYTQPEVQQKIARDLATDLIPPADNI